MKQRASAARQSIALAAGLALLILIGTFACRVTGDDETKVHYSFGLDTPPNGASDVNPHILLHWNVWSDSIMTKVVEVAELYFGTDPNPPFLRLTYWNESGYYRPGPLQQNTTYYWRIAIPSSTATSEVQSFTVNRDRTLWTYTLPPGQALYDANETPFVLGDRVCQGNEKGVVHCLDTATGSVLWIFDPAHLQAAVERRPAAVERFYFSYEKKMYCLNAASGALLWTAASLNPNLGFLGPVNAGDRVFTCTSDRIYCLDAFTGGEIWGIPRPSTPPVSLTAAEGRLFLISQWSTENFSPYFLECLDAETGRTLWTRDYGQKAWSGLPAVSGQRVYYGLDDRLACLDAASGTTIWEYITKESVAYPFTFGDRVLLAEGKGHCVLLDAGSGSLQWRTELIETPHFYWISYSGKPALVNGSLILGNNSGYIYAIDAETGAIRWHYFVTTGIGCPASWGDRIYVTGDDEYLYCLDTKE